MTAVAILPMSTTLDIATADDFATALDMMHELALGTFDRDVAAREGMPDVKHKIRVQINRQPEETPGNLFKWKSWIAGYVYVCSTGWIYQLTVTPEAPPERVAYWYKVQGLILHDARKDRIDQP